MMTALADCISIELEADDHIFGFQRSSTRLAGAGAPFRWVTGTAGRPLLSSLRLANGTIVSESETFWSATDPAGNRVLFDRLTSAIWIDKCVVKGPFREFEEKRSLSGYIFDPGAKESQAAVDSLLWLLLRSRR
ncbi:MAG TPA: hypothetical protein V6C72_12745 [Chroococcales cyanobacterium]